MQQLLEWLVETQMFEVFVTKQLEKTEWGDTMGKFSYLLDILQIVASRYTSNSG